MSGRFHFETFARDKVRDDIDPAVWLALLVALNLALWTVLVLTLPH